MCWLCQSSGDGEKILYLRLSPYEAWQPYYSLPKISVPDYRDFPNGSKGWATCQKLLKAGWKLLPSYQTSELLAS